MWLSGVLFEPAILLLLSLGTISANVLIDDTLPSEIDKSLLNSAKISVTQGIQLIGNW